jgi:hypothetical protein
MSFYSIEVAEILFAASANDNNEDLAELHNDLVSNAAKEMDQCAGELDLDSDPDEALDGINDWHLGQPSDPFEMSNKLSDWISEYADAGPHARQIFAELDRHLHPYGASDWEQKLDQLSATLEAVCNIVGPYDEFDDEVAHRDALDAARISFALDCAARVLPLVELARPTDQRPRRAIEAGRLFALGLITEDAHDDAVDAAYAAASSHADEEIARKHLNDTDWAGAACAAARAIAGVTYAPASVPLEAHDALVMAAAPTGDPSETGRAEIAYQKERQAWYEAGGALPNPLEGLDPARADVVLALFSSGLTLSVARRITVRPLPDFFEGDAA